MRIRFSTAMRTLTATFVSLPFLMFIVTEGLSADFQKGLSAAESGDFATALLEWVPLAEQGDMRAQFFLGALYHNGDGVSQNHETAVKWYTLSAEQGFDIAQGNLGVMYALGQGIVQDNVYAHMWWNIAALQGHEGATEYRDTIAERMTISQIERAQNLARECVQKNYKGC